MASLVKKPGNPNWYIQYKVDGKWKRVSTRTDKKKIALEVLNRYKAEESREYNNLPSTFKRCSLGELTERYLEHCRATMAPRWAHNKGLLLQNYLLPFFGASTPLKGVTASRIEAYQRERLKTVGNRTCNVEVFHALLPMLRKAVDWGVIPLTAIPKVEKLRETQGRLRFLSKEETQRLRDVAAKLNSELDAFVMLGLFAGLRAGEALALRWRDINFDQRIITVAPRQDWSPKMYKARVIPMNDELLSFLKAHRQTDPEAQKVISASKEGMKGRFRRLVKLAELPTVGEEKVTAHTLRHTFASHLVMGGVPLYTVGALLGHSNPATTQIYAHLAPNHLQDAVNGLNYEGIS